MKGKEQLSYAYYQADTKRYQSEFESTLENIYYIIEEETQVYQIEARIKSYRSFCNNLYEHIDNAHKKTFKNVNDCFGIKVMIEDDLAIENVINRLIEEGYHIKSIKDHLLIPNTNYNAVHVIIELKDSHIPFELQLRTPERSKDRLPHDIYKMFGANNHITYKEKIAILKDFIRLARMKMNGEYRKIKEEIPICYHLITDPKTGTKRFKVTPAKDVIKNLYPTVGEIMGETVFVKLLDKLFPPGIQERKDLLSDEEKKLFESLLEFTIQRYETKTRLGKDVNKSMMDILK